MPNWIIFNIVLLACKLLIVVISFYFFSLRSTENPEFMRNTFFYFHIIFILFSLFFSFSVPLVLCDRYHNHIYHSSSLNCTYIQRREYSTCIFIMICDEWRKIFPPTRGFGFFASFLLAHIFGNKLWLFSSIVDEADTHAYARVMFEECVHISW